MNKLDQIKERAAANEQRVNEWVQQIIVEPAQNAEDPQAKVDALVMKYTSIILGSIRYKGELMPADSPIALSQQLRLEIYFVLTGEKITTSGLPISEFFN